MEQTTIAPPAALPRPSVETEAAFQIRALPILLSIVTLALGLIYLAVIPPWGGPDEPRHFEYVALLDLKGRLVSWSDADKDVMLQIIRSMDASNFWKWGVSEWKPDSSGTLPNTFLQIWPQNAHQLHQPPLAYLTYLAAFKLAASGGINAQLYAMRFISILLNILVVLAAYATGRELFRNDPTMALALPVFVMLLPQHLFLHSTVMNDHLVEAALAWMIALLTRTFRLGLSLPRVVGMLALLAIGLAAKRSALYGVPILAVAFVVYALMRWGGGHLSNGQKIARVAGAVIVFSVGALGLLFAWQWIGVNQPKFHDYVVRLFLFLPSEQFPLELDPRQLVSPAALPLYASYFKYVFISTWGHFGWMNITLGVQAYWLFTAVCIVAFLGLAWFAFHDFSKLLVAQRATLVVFAASVLVGLFFIVALEVRFWNLGWGGDPQGRYLFPVLIPLATLFLLGLRAFIPNRFYGWWLAVLSGALVLYNVIALGFFIIPFYRA